MRRREAEEIDSVCVSRARNEHLDAIFDVVDDNVVTCDVHELLLLVHLQAIVQLTVAAEDKLRRNGYSLHAHIGHYHAVSYFVEKFK